ncbi:MAG: O-antigen ligase family protein [Nitrososphaerales archaeon]
MTPAELALGRAIQRSRGFARTLADAEPWLVGPFLVLGLMIPRLLGAALAAAAAFWVVRWIAWGRATVRTAGDWPVAVLILLIPLTLWVTALPDITRQQVLWLVSGIALYYTIANWMRTAGRERAVVFCLVGAGLLAALLAPVAVVWVTDIKLTVIPEALYRRLPLLAASPVHPNVLAGALVLGLPVPLALLMFDAGRMQRHERLAAAVAVTGIAAILVLTKSRGALLAAAAAALVLCVLRWRRGWIAIVVATLLAGLGLWLIGLPQIVEKLSTTGATVGGPGRFEIWSRGVYLVQDFPFTGIGMGTYRQVTNALYPFFLLGPVADVPHAHNLFLQVAVDLGIPGLVAWLGLLFLAAFSAWRVYRSGRRDDVGWAAGLGAGLVCSQLALVIHGMLDAAVWGAHSGIVVWALWGICMGSYNLRNTAYVRD